MLGHVFGAIDCIYAYLNMLNHSPAIREQRELNAVWGCVKKHFMIELSSSSSNLVSSAKGRFDNIVERLVSEIWSDQKSWLWNYHRCRYKVHGNFRLFLYLTLGSVLLNVILILVLRSKVCSIARCELIRQDIPIARHRMLVNRTQENGLKTKLLSHLQ